jgi:hypothetical protein
MFELAILILVILILVIMYQRRVSREGMCSDDISPPPGYAVTIDSDGNPILTSSNEVDGSADDSSAVPVGGYSSQVDLKNVALQSVDGKTGYYKNGSFVPLYGSNDTGNVNTDISSLKTFGSVANTAMPSDMSTTTMSAVARSAAPDMSEDINWDRSLAPETTYTPGNGSTAPIGTTRENFGSVHTGQSFVAASNYVRGSQNTFGSILYESQSNLPVFDLVPVPSVNPQLKAVAAATSLAPDPFNPPASTAYPVFG